MASPRRLGGGRVLGSGRNLSPAVAPHARVSSMVVSPSASSVSLNSQLSTQPTETQDLSSRVSLDQGDPALAGAGPASTRLVCPICNEEMVTLLQLNRHLDDDHKNLEEVEQDEVKTWFRTQMVKAKRFQPLAVLNQKLKGLDVFEPNDVPTAPAPRGASASTLEMVRADPDEAVTRSHWQRTGVNDACAEPMCGRSLGVVNGTVNCRNCGKLFCEEHTMYQMKLSRSAQHEPVRGFWCRVCETCYKSRDGYNDHNGVSRDHTGELTKMRRKTVDKAYLEVTRLEKRLTKLTQLLTQSLEEQNAGMLWSLPGQKNPRKVLEQSVVTWEDNAGVSKCPFCQQEFSNYSFRRHHCRLCGRVVCGDPQTGCSSEVGLDVAARTDQLSEKATGGVSVDVRMCRDCQGTVFGRRDIAQEMATKPRDLKAYETLVQFERGIRLMLPKFQRLLVALQDPDRAPSPTQLSEATKVRKRLMDAFSQYDISARRLRDLPTKSPTQQRLQKAVYQQATNFLHLHMLPLRTLPKILRHASPSPNGNGNSSSSTLASSRPSTSTPSLLAPIKRNSPSPSSASASAISALESEEKKLRERLVVLEEQHFLVQDMLKDANRRRKFDEVAALAANEGDLRGEMDGIRKALEGLDFEGAYAGN
ncbi:MAG: carboxypeptidase Y-deficient [Thelocarpon impressellum]|nr:MAG: carboxypeptidase Y-deficient [Thelocarpon impressellum]